MRLFFLALALPFLLAPEPVSAQTEMAITVDDLPTHGAMPRGTSRLEIARDLIRAFKNHRVTAVAGFVNGKQVQENPEHLSVLQEWVRVGFPLANHTFSHLNLDRVTPGEYVGDIAENERFLSRYPRAPSFRAFRYPYLAEGDSLDKRNAVRAWLGATGHRIAQVSVYFDDWAWNDPYVRCVARADLRSIDWLKRSFVEIGLRRLRWSEEVARIIFSRPIKQILLLHMGTFGALMVDDLLTAYGKAGVLLIDLEAAMRDRAYDENPDVAWNGELTFLEQMIRAKRLALLPAPEIPFRQLDRLCRYGAQGLLVEPRQSEIV